MSSKEATGSSKSLNITAKAIKRFMKITDRRPKDRKLREWVYSLIGAFARSSEKSSLGFVNSHS